MITHEEFIVIHTLHKQGKSMREISRITGLDRRTISKRLKQDLRTTKEKNLHFYSRPF